VGWGALNGRYEKKNRNEKEVINSRRGGIMGRKGIERVGGKDLCSLLGQKLFAWGIWQIAGHEAAVR